MITYLIPVCNELVELDRLITFLHLHKRQVDNIHVNVDTNHPESEPVHDFIKKKIDDLNLDISLSTVPFEGDFSEYKNKIHEHLPKSTSYVFQIDADEMISSEFILYLPHILDKNKSIDVWGMCRENTVENITEEYIKKWGWTLSYTDNGKEVINYPDIQYRIYKFNNNIKWKNKVHEILSGHTEYTILPPNLCLYHDKDIKRQIKQNNLYENI